MDNLGKSVGYLKGLMEGMDFSDDPSKEKLLNAMVDLLSVLSDRVEALEELVDDLNDYVESIDDDLSQLEEDRGSDYPMMDDEDDEFEDPFLDDMHSGEDQLHLLNGKAEGEDEGETLAGAICPDCKKLFFVGADDPQDSMYSCPHCGHKVAPDPLTPDNAPIARPEGND